jgi:hypothetical protein
MVKSSKRKSKELQHQKQKHERRVARVAEALGRPSATPSSLPARPLARAGVKGQPHRPRKSHRVRAPNFQVS